jgi:putative transposase
MDEKFQHKYRIPSTRLQQWDYGWDAAYFVTICTKDRECFFGDIINDVMHLSGIGIIADVLWYEIKNHAKNIELGEFVVMPNHIHGIIILNGNGASTPATGRVVLENPDNSNVPTGSAGINHSGDIDGSINSGNPEDSGVSEVSDISGVSGVSDVSDVSDVETRHALSLQGPTPGQTRFQNQGRNTLSSIIGSYKSAVTRHAHRLQFDFGWQPRFHEHIIRDGKSFDHISAYIVSNPSGWQADKFFK